MIQSFTNRDTERVGLLSTTVQSEADVTLENEATWLLFG
jgi:hypothetical protein